MNIFFDILNYTLISADLTLFFIVEMIACRIIQIPQKPGHTFQKCGVAKYFDSKLMFFGKCAGAILIDIIYNLKIKSN